MLPYLKMLADQAERFKIILNGALRRWKEFDYLLRSECQFCYLGHNQGAPPATLPVIIPESARKARGGTSLYNL